MKIKNNVKHFNVIYVLVVFLLFALMPLTYTTIAEGEYQISTEQQLKDWLQNTDNVQTNNPNALLTTDINFGWSGVAPLAASINSNSILNGGNFTITFTDGYTVVGEGESERKYFGMFTTYLSGTLKNMNFVFSVDRTVIIDYDAAHGNEGIFSGIVAASIENGTIDNCHININVNLTYNSNNSSGTVGGLGSTGRSSNHSGGFSGRMIGNSIIKNSSISQSANTTISVTTSQRYANYIRWGMIASDSYSQDGQTPQLINIVVERYGYISLINNNKADQDGNCLYGIAVADMSTESPNDTYHAVIINGLIYNGVGGSVTNQITYTKDTGGASWHHLYFVGRSGNTNPGANFTVSNIYSYVTLTDESYLQEEAGVSVIPEGYTFSFDPSSEGNVIITKNNANDTDFIYSISQAEMGTTYDTYLQLSSSVSLGKFDTSRDKGLDTITILDGTKIENASFGFQYSEVIYNGFAYGAIFKVNDQIITDGFTVSYTNNLNSTITNGGQKATCSLDHPDIESGIFLHSTRYYVDNNKIDYLNLEMTINQAPLTLTYTGSNVYDNNLAINGLVNDQEKLTIDGNTYTNGNYQFDCVNNNTLKTIEFIDNIIKTNYLISYEGIENDQFTVNPKVITVDEGITITNAQDQTIANFADNVLTIYSKSYNTIELTFAQEEGYLNRAIFNTNNDTTYNIVSSLEGTTMSYVVSPQNENDFAFIEDLTLDVSLTRVALRFEINDKSLISSLKVNGEDVYKFGNYFAFDCDYNEMATITVTAAEGDYTIEFLVNDMPASSSDGTLTVNAKGDANNMMYIKINITAA